MSDFTETSDPEGDAIAEAAAEWITERRDGFSPARAAAFKAWCWADPRHRAAAERAEQALGLLDRMPAIRGALAEERTAPIPSDAARPAVFRMLGWTGSLAATLVLGYAAWWYAPTLGWREQRVATDANSARELALRDGSILNLNANSEIRVTLTTRERRIVLASGEAHFNVAPDPERPFVVHAVGVAVRAVGTAFNVHTLPGGVEVVVVHGRVEVSRDTAQPPGTAGGTVLLSAGERAWIPHRSNVAAPDIEKLDAPRLRAVVAWRRQAVSFKDAPLGEVVRRFNQSNVQQLVLADKTIAGQKIGGTFEIDQVHDFVRLLEQDGEIVAELRGPREILLRRASAPAR